MSQTGDERLIREAFEKDSPREISAGRRTIRIYLDEGNDERPASFVLSGWNGEREREKHRFVRRRTAEKRSLSTTLDCRQLCFSVTAQIRRLFSPNECEKNRIQCDSIVMIEISSSTYANEKQKNEIAQSRGICVLGCCSFISSSPFNRCQSPS